MLATYSTKNIAGERRNKDIKPGRPSRPNMAKKGAREKKEGKLKEKRKGIKE